MRKSNLAERREPPGDVTLDSTTRAFTLRDKQPQNQCQVVVDMSVAGMDPGVAWAMTGAESAEESF